MNKEDLQLNIANITLDLEEAYNKLHSLDKIIAVFGSGRIDKDDFYYKKAYDLSHKLSNNGFTIITGGSSGIMEAGNKGAKTSAGVLIQLPREQKTNKYINITVQTHSLLTRKHALIHYAHGFLVFPGGFGTLDELSEIICLKQTKLIKKIPIILFGTKFFQPLLELL